MAAHHQDLARRLDSLERQNRLWKGGALAALLGASLLGLQSFAAPATCDVVSAERIVLRNSRGKQRIVLDAYSGAQPTITFHDKKGKPATQLQLGDTGDFDLSVFQAGKRSPASFRVDGSHLGLGSLKARQHKPESKEELSGQGID